MAFDKVVDSLKLNAAMKATADKIRAEAKTSNLIEWDESNGFADSINTQTKTATPSTNLQAIRPDAGYVGLSQVNVEAIEPITQATPSISVSSGGLITASATQTAGYVAEGTKSATKQLSTQAAKTVTPTTSNQTAVASGKYTTGAITVKGDANLKAANILRGVSIFGVAGSLVNNQIATGTFQDTSGDFERASGLTVSGLSFTPSRVIIFPKTTGTLSRTVGITFADSLGSICFAGYYEEYYDEDADEYYDEFYIRCFDDSDGFEFTLTNNGFNLKLVHLSDGSRHDIELDSEGYNYIAIG